MQHAGGRVEAEVLVWGDAWGKPAVGGGPFEGEHVVGEGTAEDESMVGSERARVGGAGDLELRQVDVAEFRVSGVGGLKRGFGVESSAALRGRA